MTRTLPVLAACLVLGTILPGCFGYPEDTVLASDELGVLYTAKAAGSDATLPNECYIGPPFEPVPAQVKEKFLGRTFTPDAPLTATATVPAGIACHRVHRIRDVAIEEDRSDRYQSVATTAFQSAVGEPAVVGREYTVPTPEGPFTFVVIRANETMVEIEPGLPERGSSPDLGLDLLPSFRGDKYIVTMVANVSGQVFEGPIGTVIPMVGNLSVVGQIGKEILVAEETARPVLGSAAVELKLTALFAKPATRTLPDDGFGHRGSSVVGTEAGPRSLTQSTSPAAADDH